MFQPSLRDSVILVHAFPALKCWAIFKSSLTGLFIRLLYFGQLAAGLLRSVPADLGSGALVPSDL